MQKELSLGTTQPTVISVCKIPRCNFVDPHPPHIWHICRPRKPALLPSLQKSQIPSTRISNH